VTKEEAEKNFGLKFSSGPPRFKNEKKKELDIQKSMSQLEEEQSQKNK